MYWQEEEQKTFSVPERVVDLLYTIRCPTLPADHAWSLSQEIQRALPWFADEPQAGLHIIHGADSGNGWERPQQGDALLHLSRRTKLILRLPRHRVADAAALNGRTLTPADHPMEIVSCKTRPLSMTTILYSRYVAVDREWDEERFIDWAAGELRRMGVRFKKLLAGRSGRLATAGEPLTTRSLMVADLPFEDAVTLQEEGLGPHRILGCGLFLQQKGF